MLMRVVDDAAYLSELSRHAECFSLLRRSSILYPPAHKTPTRAGRLPGLHQAGSYVWVILSAPGAESRGSRVFVKDQCQPIRKSMASEHRYNPENSPENGRFRRRQVQVTKCALIPRKVLLGGKDHLRITAQFVEVMDQIRLWFQDYDCQAQNILNVEDDIAKGCAGDAVAPESRNDKQSWHGHAQLIRKSLTPI